MVVGLLLMLCLQRWSLLTSLQDKGSYALGQQWGQNFKRYNIEISPGALRAGVQDALANSVRLSPQEQQAGVDFIHAEARKNNKASTEPPH